MRQTAERVGQELAVSQRSGYIVRVGSLGKPDAPFGNLGFKF